MKLFVALFAMVAVAAAELKWSEDGQYRLIETEPIHYVPSLPLAEPSVRIAPESIPVAHLPLKYTADGATVKLAPAAEPVTISRTNLGYHTLAYSPYAYHPMDSLYRSYFY